jgi:hypothetical protein
MAVREHAGIADFADAPPYVVQPLESLSVEVRGLVRLSDLSEDGRPSTGGTRCTAALNSSREAGSLGPGGRILGAAGASCLRRAWPLLARFMLS